MLERQKNPRFREILTQIREKITSGVALSDAFASYGDLFPAIYSTSIRAGERSGDLEGVLKRFLRYQKMIVNLRKRVVGAMIYPTVLVLHVDGDDLRDAHLRHPEVRRVLHRLRRGAAVVHGADDQRGHDHARQRLAGARRHRSWSSSSLNRWVKTTSGRLMWDRVKLRIPLVGGVLHRFAIMQFTQSLGTLLTRRHADGAGHRDRLAVGHQSARGARASPASCRTCAKASRCGARWTRPAS